MKARYYLALSAVAAGLVALPHAEATAQATRTADPNAPRLMVGVFRAADKSVGVNTADAIRNRITQDINVRSMWVIPKQDIVNTLEASGFPTTEALAPHDARALGQLLRADEYIVGNVLRDSAGVRVDAQLVLTRDNSLVQPLGSFRAGRAEQTANAISREFQQAHKQFQSERNCVNAAREKKYADAIAAARRGIAEYPRATLARICLANVYIDQRDAATAAPAKTAYNDSASAVARDILAVDPLSRRALTIQYDALKSKNDPGATDVLLRLAAADPTNTRLLEQVINELAGGGQAQRALPFANKLVEDNPGDPNALQLQMRVRLAANDLKGGIAAGEELIRTDTSFATARLFDRLAVAALTDSQPQKAAQIAAQGFAKFPTDAEVLSTYLLALQRSGQTQQALQVVQQGLARNPNSATLLAAQGQLYAESGQQSQALDALRRAAQGGDSASKAAVSNTALRIGQQLQRTANGSKRPEDFQAALSFLEVANAANRSPEGALLQGATALSYGQALLTQAQNQAKARNNSGACTSSRQAKQQFDVAQTTIPDGGRANPQAAQQLLAALNQLAPYADQIGKAVCK